jgi:hypothetical protein
MVFSFLINNYNTKQKGTQLNYFSGESPGGYLRGFLGFLGLSGLASVSGTGVVSKAPGLSGGNRSGTTVGGLMCVIGLLGSGFFAITVYLH